MDMFSPVDTSAGPPYEFGYRENHWPQTPATFRSVAEEYIEALLALATMLMKVIAQGINIDESVFLTRIDKAFWNSRFLLYEGVQLQSSDAAVSGIGEHTGIRSYLS